ncbi:sialic acid-binding Ig-like lectin 14 [Echinops telfairi]|uniref:Sialic acid-binding Ig-like lectin 14 n=1 Tax=Echinops telfairi TaxID=9371 RepID=A0AC55D9U2_ECHTE|nr:sialic acid-binding Ig-like lectin 14 [Echinops telfairi]
MLSWLLLPLLWVGSLQEDKGYELQVPLWMSVQEGLCLTVPCKFIYPWESHYHPDTLYIFWFEGGGNVQHAPVVATNHPTRAVKPRTKGRFQLIGDPLTNNCSLSIRDARRSDSETYSFRVERGPKVQYTYQNRRLTVLVTDLTEKPHIHILQPLASGRPANLACSLPGSCEGARPLAFSWVGEALNETDPTTRQSPVLTFTPRPQDHGTNLTCRVRQEGSSVTTEVTILLNVSRKIEKGHPGPHHSPLPETPHTVATSVLQRNYTESPPCCPCLSQLEEGSGPLIRTVVRGILMGAGFLLTYGLTWAYYTRCSSPQGRQAD